MPDPVDTAPVETLPKSPSTGQTPAWAEGYSVLDIAGRGAMGVVFRAVQTGLNRVVALKMLRADDATPAELARFRAEAELVAAVRHPHTVAVYDVGRDPAAPYLAMEYLPGGTLTDRLRDGPLAARRAAGLVEAVARGVAAAHAQGVVHRDLKPGNILFDADGVPKVADFGLAKRGGTDATRTGAILGTPSYMAPEQAGGGGKFATPAADVWALGVVLYECLTGARPFAGDSALDVLAKVQADEPASVRSLVPTVPRGLDTIVRKCLQKDPTRRYPSAAELADDLRRHINGEPLSARRAGRAERAVLWARRKPTLAVASVAVPLAVGLAGFTAPPRPACTAPRAPP
jgi:eukaryotic-like serine/threonine-protein kinase